MEERGEEKRERERERKKERRHMNGKGSSEMRK